MQIQSNNQFSFKAKIINNQTYNNIMVHALENNKFSKFLKTMENIDNYEKDTFIEMNMCYTGKYPTVVFSRYIKNKDGDLIMTKQTDYMSPKPDKNLIEYALKMFFKLGANRGNNPTYKEIVIKPDKNNLPYCLF